MTVLEGIQRSAEFLTKKGVESPRLQVELLLAHLLRLPRMKLYLNFERTLLEAEVCELREMVKRRGNREPLQHITGTTNFCGYDFAVNSHVLVPRPETELLAERAWKFLQTSLKKSGLDYGTGSGCIAVLIALKCPEAELYAVDISQEALLIARQNATAHGVGQKIQFHQGDGFQSLPPAKTFNLIVSNPPYIPSDEIPVLEPEVKVYDPILALDGGMDGLKFYRKLAQEAVARLEPEGRLMLEFGEGQAPEIKKILEAQMWIVEAVERDYSQRERFIIARRN